MRQRFVAPLCIMGLVLAILACNFSAAPATPVAPTATVANAVTPTPAASASPAPGATPARAFDLASFKQALDPGVAAYMAANNVAGCSVAIAYPGTAGGPLLTQVYSYGLASKATPRPVTPATEFEIGSLSKLFTADLLALFVGQGQMALDDPLQKYLPASVHVPTFNQHAITLRRLATHTSGLPRTDGLPSIRMVNGVSIFGDATDDELYHFLNTYPLTRAPGAMWLYSNLAQGYGADGQPAAAAATTSASLAAGGLRSTATDLAAYLVANIDPSATPLAQALTLTQQRQSIGPKPGVVMGLGWLIASPGTPAEQYSKDGATAGFTAYIAFSPSRRSGFAAACIGHNVSQSLAPQINTLLLGASETESDDTP
jgi:CubicO group peptidase (beta-lactamase class C family)